MSSGSFLTRHVVFELSVWEFKVLISQNVRRVTPYPSREVSDARRYQTRGAEGAYAMGGGGGGQEALDR